MSEHTMSSARRFVDGQIIGYISAIPAGCFLCQVVRYADPAEQNDAASPLLYIRTRGGETPFRVRENQLHAPRYAAHFTPETWVNNQAVETTPAGPQEWDCTEHARGNRDYLVRLETQSEPLDQPGGAVDNDNVFKDDPAAPAWVRDWSGPFTIRISRKDVGKDAMPDDIMVAGAAAVEAAAAADEAAALHADALCQVAALLAASLVPAAATVVFDRDEDTVSAETKITLVYVRDRNGGLLWYNDDTEYAEHPDAQAMGEPPNLDYGDLDKVQDQIRDTYDAHLGHFETTGDDVMPFANLLVLPVPYPDAEEGAVSENRPTSRAAHSGDLQETVTEQTELDGLGTDELHTSMLEAVRGLPETHPVRVIWGRMDAILTDGGTACLPAPWDEHSEPEHEQSDATIDRLTSEVSRLRSTVTAGVGAAIRSVRQRGHELTLPLELVEFLTGGAETAALAEPEALPRDNFEVVSSALSNCSVAEGLRCLKCGAIITRAGSVRQQGHRLSLAGGTIQRACSGQMSTSSDTTAFRQVQTAARRRQVRVLLTALGTVVPEATDTASRLS